MLVATSVTGTTAIGNQCLDALTTGDNNTGVGAGALGACSNGGKHTAVGLGALQDQTGGEENTAVGYLALHNSTTSSGNVAVGQEALGAVAGNFNVAIGRESLNDCTAADNVAVGKAALDTVSTGTRNVGIGKVAGDLVTTGNDNVLLGSNAGDNIVTGSQNVCIGTDTSLSSSSGGNQIAMGQNVTCSGNSNFTFGDGATDSNIAFGATTITAPSDIRLKEDIEDEKIGLDFINDLRPVTFRWKKAKDVPSEMKAHNANSEKRVMNGKYNHGFVAQEVKEVIDKYDLKDGFDMWTEDEADGRQRIGEASLMPLMVKAVQELSARVKELENKE